jgi:zinc protease
MSHFIPEVYQEGLPNGMRLVGVEYARVPWVSLTCMVKRGAETDPPGKAGVADWTAEYLSLGTARRSQKELALEVESLGARLSVRADFDATYIALEGLAEDFVALMNLLAEVVQTPAFPEEEFPLLRERRRGDLAQVLNDPREVATRAFRRLFFAGAPYGHDPRGEPESLEALALKDLKHHYQREFSPAVSSLVVVGMLPRAQVLEEAQRAFGAWAGGGPPSPPYTDPPPRPAAPGLYLLDRPELTQSEIRMGHLGPPRRHPDFFPLRLVNYVLGEGGFSSRLMSRIRSDLGLTYGIRSHFFFRRAPGPFTISTFTPAATTAQVVREIREVMQEVAARGLTPQELAEAQSYYIGHFPLALETPRTIARQVVAMDLYDLEPDYLHHYCRRLREVTLEAAQAAARQHLHPEELVALVVGPAQTCAADLEALGPLNLLHEI